MKTKFAFLAIITFILPYGIFAQDHIVIVGKPKTPLSDASKMTISPNVKDTNTVNVDFSYSLETSQYNTEFEVSEINAAKISPENISKLYNTYIKLGFANYMMPYFQLNHNSNRSKNTVYGINLKHYSAAGKIKIDGEKTFSGFAENEISIFGKKIFRKSVLTADAGFARNSYYYYARPDSAYTSLFDVYTEKKDIQNQNFNYLNASSSLFSIHPDSSHLNYKLKFAFDFMNDSEKNNEKDFVLNADFNKFRGSELLGLNTKFRLLDRKLMGDTTLNAYLTLNPWIGFKGKDWKINLGLDLMSKMNADDNAKFHLYPNIYMQYSILEGFMVPYIKIGGNLQALTYRDLSSENPFIDPNTEIYDINNTIKIKGGLKGNFSPRISYDLNLGYCETENMYFYVNNTVSVQKDSTPALETLYYGGNKFDLLTDTVMMVNLQGKLGFRQSEKLSFTLQADYFIYTMQSLSHPWHKPDFLVRFNTKYNIRNIILAHLDINAIGGYYIPTTGFTTLTEINPEKTPAHIDINLGLEYRYNKKISAFIYLKNITGKNYEQYNRYPGYGFQAMLGLTYSL
ncbi:MAG: TonB-dependent receptor [Bacteroidales bacterium]|nr:TonB-dependent receptor [Bacteroidales bacterium]